ncbi:MAG TPA: hypothetical protein PLP19_04970 [bacterium]|nr:hypothetical protein [bacterium]HPN42824.1 hypothetical protein [bacterium]
MKTKTIKNVSNAKKHQAVFLDLTARNYQLFGLGALVIVVGYVFLSKGPAESFWSLTLAPILLVIGYCILVPLAIFWRSKKDKEPQQ